MNNLRFIKIFNDFKKYLFQTIPSFNPKNKGKQNGDSENDGSIYFIYFKHNFTTNVYHFISVVKKSKEQKVEEARKLFLLWKLIITDLKV